MQFSKALACAILSIATALPANQLYQRAESGNAFRDGAHGAATNAAQVIDSLGRQLKSGDGHPTADMIGAFITGADSQIDNAAAFLGEVLDPITLGASGMLASVALGPFAQSVTNGAEVLVSNIVGAPIDLIAGPAMRSFAESLAKVSAAAKANKLDTQKLDAVTAQLNSKIAAAQKSLASGSAGAKATTAPSTAKPSTSAVVSGVKASTTLASTGKATGAAPSATLAKRAESGNALRNGAHGAVTNAAQVIDSLGRQLKSGDGHPTADMISAFITGADSQIDNAAAFLGEALDPITLGASGAVASLALGPFAQSVTNGAEVLLSNIVGAPIDLIAGPAMKAFTKNLAKVSAAAKANQIDTQKLDAVTAQLNAKIYAASTSLKASATAAPATALQVPNYNTGTPTLTVGSVSLPKSSALASTTY